MSLDKLEATVMKRHMIHDNKGGGEEESLWLSNTGSCTNLRSIVTMLYLACGKKIPRPRKVLVNGQSFEC